MIQEQNILEVIASCDIKIGNYSENCARLMRELKENTQLSPFTHLNIVVNRNESRQTATTRIRVIYPFKFSIDKGTNSSEDMLAVARSHADDIADVIGNVEAKLQMAFIIVNKQTQAVFDVNFSKQYFAQADKAQLLNTTIFAYVSEYELICEIVDADVTIQPLPPYPPIPVKPTQHNTLMGLDYAHAGHTGFQKALSSDNAGNNITITHDAQGNAIINAQVPSAAVWGNISGDLENQTDLYNILQLLQQATNTNANDISTINSKIPAQATSDNQLADKAFVNSSIATNTATFMGTVTAANDTETAAQAALSSIAGMDINDYAFVEVPNTPQIGVDKFKRYKYNGSAWVYEYTLNNSSFTANQWAAINSGITDSKVSTYDGYATSKQNTLTAGDNITIIGDTISAQVGGAPILYPTTASEVTTTSMVVKSCVSDNGKIITERGFVYDTSPSPVITGNKLICDVGIGMMDGELDNLTQNTEYHIRSYGINASGVNYGSELVQRTVNRPIPVEYQLVEYIQCNGQEYISLPWHLETSKLTIITLKNVNVLNDNSWRALFGTYIGSAPSINNLYLQKRATNNAYQFVINGNDYRVSGVGANFLEIETIITSTNVIVRFDGIDRISETGSYNSVVNTVDLFRLSVAGIDYFKGDIYSFVISEDNVDKYALYPVYRIADNKPGMYDIVNGVFYTNQGTGEFTVGPDKQWE